MNVPELKNPIKVNTLGSFSISYEDAILLVGQGRSYKVWNLLAYLIVNRNKSLSPSELMEVLCSEEGIQDPANAVKNLVYRLRCNIAKSKMPPLNYVVQSGGIYSWNNDIPIEVDADLFVNKWKAASSLNVSNDEALLLYLEAIDLYEGRFIPSLEYEEWTVSLSVYYHTIFTECVKQVFRILSDREDYLSIISICEKAIALDPYEEDIYIIYIYALIKMDRQKEAFTQYELIKGILYNELGVNPSEEMCELYKEIIKSINSVELDLKNIRNELNEKSTIDGAFCTEYEIFKEIYRFVSRGLERSGSSVYLMLITLNDGKKTSSKSASLITAMDKLKTTISSALRKGDLFTQYSRSQFVVMLPGTSLENGFMVGERIVSAYKKSGASRNVDVKYKLQPIDSSLWDNL